MTTLTSVFAFAPVPYVLSPALSSMLQDFAKARRMQAGKHSGGKSHYAPKASKAASIFDAEGCRKGSQRPVNVHVDLNVQSVPMHKLILAELPSAMIALRVKDAPLGKLFVNSKQLRSYMTEDECFQVYATDKLYAKKPEGVGLTEWNGVKNEAVGRIVREAISRMINSARYTLQDAPMGTVIGTRNKLEFLTELPALAKIKVIKVRKVDDDEQPRIKGKRANKVAAK